MTSQEEKMILEYAASNALNYGPFTPLRIGGPLLFALLATLMYQMHRPVGVVILTTTAATTFAAHRPRKMRTADSIEVLDFLAICVWMMYNTFVMLSAIANLTKTYSPVLVVFLLASAMWTAGVTIIFDDLRCRFPYRSLVRDLLHLCMHATGVCCTCLLLWAVSL